MVRKGRGKDTGWHSAHHHLPVHMGTGASRGRRRLLTLHAAADDNDDEEVKEKEEKEGGGGGGGGGSIWDTAGELAAQTLPMLPSSGG